MTALDNINARILIQHSLRTVHQAMLTPEYQTSDVQRLMAMMREAAELSLRLQIEQNIISSSSKIASLAVDPEDPDSVCLTLLIFPSRPPDMEVSIASKIPLPKDDTP